ncbi:hypothetical protein CRENBAI_008420 [Crenichthys baileyi]|uniref:Uncharacterized protein n=1 Tax=Crenichthys baileyi TaxID=28760 RepID=A0AAV9RF29_9TELE
MVLALGGYGVSETRGYRGYTGWCGIWGRISHSPTLNLGGSHFTSYGSREGLWDKDHTVEWFRLALSMWWDYNSSTTDVARWLVRTTSVALLAYSNARAQLKLM